jgi:PKD repeat protein
MSHFGVIFRIRGILSQRVHQKEIAMGATGFMRYSGGALFGLGILAAALVPRPSAANSADQVVLQCGPAGGGDNISHGFYVPAFTADRLQRVVLRLDGSVDGDYTFALTARKGTFDGALIGVATAQATMTVPVPQDVSFEFHAAPVDRGSTVTFQIAIVSGPPLGNAHMDIGPCGLGDAGCTLCGGQIIETENATPPLSTFRRNSLYATIYAPPCEISCSADAPQRAPFGSVVTFTAQTQSQDCTGGWTLEWKFGDGTPLGYGSPVDHAYAAPGVYTWNFTASLGGAVCSKVGVVRVGSELFASPSGSGAECSQAVPCTLPGALSKAQDGDTVILAGGTYTSAESEVARIEKSIALIGGWDGAPTGPPSIDPENPQSILDGEDARRAVWIKAGSFPFLQRLAIRRGMHPDDGGGIYADSAGLSLDGVSVTDCRVNHQGPTNSHGGGVYMYDGNLYVTACLFKGNWGSCTGCLNSQGGGIYVKDAGRVEIASSTFENNGAWTGGAAFIEGSGFEVTDSIFVYNGNGAPAATAYGSALFIQNGSGTVRWSDFAYNHAGDRGILNVENSTAEVLECSITRNSAQAEPGLYAPGSHLRVVNCIIADNAPFYDDISALWVNSDSTLLHNTVVRNVGSNGGTGVWVGGGTITLRDNIIAGHTTGLRTYDTAVVSSDYTLWGAGIWGNTADVAGGGVVTRTADLFGDPMFVDPTTGNYHIAVGSAAQDAGVNAGIFQDFYGDARPMGSGFDVGADEIQVGVPLQVYSSLNVSTGAAPLEVAFSGGYTGGAPMYTFDWDFGDGTAHSAEQAPHHTYTAPGTYQPTFTVRDGFGSTATAPLHTVTVVEPCTLDCAATVAAETGVDIQESFEATASPSNCTELPAFVWDFGDGADLSHSASASHTYTWPGTYTWTLTVTLGDLTCVKTGSIAVCSFDTAPTANPPAGPAPLPIQFRANPTPSACQGTPEFLWSFGDGSTSVEQDPSHTFGVPGTYLWSLHAVHHFAHGDLIADHGGSIVVSPSVPGDCNGDGTVSIGEVQKAINMFLGIEPVGCGADCNGDGSVSIGEVQKVVNAFLGLPSSC